MHARPSTARGNPHATGDAIASCRDVNLPMAQQTGG
jgi:hypothetical protein